MTVDHPRSAASVGTELVAELARVKAEAERVAFEKDQALLSRLAAMDAHLEMLSRAVLSLLERQGEPCPSGVTEADLLRAAGSVRVRDVARHLAALKSAPDTRRLERLSDQLASLSRTSEPPCDA